MNKTVLLVLLLMPLLIGCQQQTVKKAEAEPVQVGDVELLRKQANDAYNNQQYAKALPMYQQLVSVSPNEPALWLRLGNIQASQKQQTNAIKSYRKAISLQPEMSVAYFNMAVLQLRQSAATLSAMVKNVPETDPLYKRGEALSNATLRLLGVKK